MPQSNSSPYAKVRESNWPAKTQELVADHPLADQLVELVLEAWEDIFRSRIGSKRFVIGRDIFPAPQILGYLLHELIPLLLERDYPRQWRRDRDSTEKDVVNVRRPQYSFEIKTSSSQQGIYGNRSAAQSPTVSKKQKSGYYLVVNFSKCSKHDPKPEIRRVRFGWLDHKDWKGQRKESGQQSTLRKGIAPSKLLTLYPTKSRSE